MNIPAQEELQDGLSYTNVFGFDGLCEISARCPERGDVTRFRVFAMHEGKGFPVSHLYHLRDEDAASDDFMRRAKAEIEEELRRLLA